MSDEQNLRLRTQVSQPVGRVMRPIPSAMKTSASTLLALLAALGLVPCRVPAGVAEDMALLRGRCLFYAAGRAPNDAGTVSIRHGLWAQSPFSPAGEIDLAASGFSLAALPAAVATNVITLSQGTQIATAAAARIKEMVTKSAQASSPAARALYGYKGMLFHYYTWDAAAGEFRGRPVEVSSIDSTLLMTGLCACAQYFGGTVLSDYLAARDLIDWRSWLDTTTAGHENQFRMAWYPASGFSGWLDWWSHETLLVNVQAAASDTTLDVRALWNAWHRDLVTYVSPGPDSQTFTCYATYFGDPFTVFYGTALLGLHRCPADFNGVDWFSQSRTAFHGHVEYFRKERGFLDSLTFAFFNGATGAIARPKSSPDAPLAVTEAPIYSVAGGLPFYSSDPASNPLAVTLSQLMSTTPAFFQWHGWPAATVTAAQTPHQVASGYIIGQDISLTALALDNLLSGGRVHDLIFADPRIAGALSVIFPPQITAMTVNAGNVSISWSGVPRSSARVERSVDLSGWQDAGQVTFSPDGTLTWSGPLLGGREFYRLKLLR